MEYDIFLDMQKANWDLWSHQQECRQEFVLNCLELQSISRQISILRFFSENINYVPSEYSPIAFTNVIKQIPVKFLSKFSTRQYLYLHDYLVKMITYPRAMASIISNYFTKEDIRLSFFAHVTFPSIFHNFITEELHKAGASLVKFIIQNHPVHLIKPFFMSFIGISTDFFASIWVNFDMKQKEFNKIHKEDKIEHSECLVDIFISSLSKSLCYLSISQIELFKSLLQRSKELFGMIVIQNMLLGSYFEYYQDKIKAIKHTAIYQMLKTAGFYPTSSFFNKIADTIITPKYTKTRPSHHESGLTNQVPIVLSLHELYVIQQIIFNGSNSKSPNNSENNSQSKSTNDNIELINSNKIIKAQKPGGFAIFSYQACKNHFEPLYLDLDLTSFFAKNDESMQVSLFTNSLINANNNKSNSSANTSNTGIKRNDKKVIKFIKDFDLLLAHISTGKFFKSLVREKKMDLFVTLGLYSRQCVEHSKKKHKKTIDWKALFTPNSTLGMHRENLSFSVNLNLNFPRSLSIGNIHHHDNSKKDEDKKESDEEKIQKDLDQLKLSKDVKEKLTKLLQKFGKPNDEISMFVLVRQLDIYESASKDNNSNIKENVNIENKKIDIIDDCENEYFFEEDEEDDKSQKISYLNSNYPVSFQKFKESIKQMKESSENLINKVDENGYFLKFIKKCANGIDNLADSSHFEMIFGLVFIGLELNEISIHISENGINSSKENFNVMKPFINCLFMHSNDKMFDVFVWYHRFINTFPEIKKIIPKKSRIFIDLLVDYFYENIKIDEEKK